MQTEISAVIADANLSPEACRVVLYVAAKGDGPHEISHREFARILGQPGEKRLRAAIQDAVDLYLDRTPGGRSHHDRYEFRVAPDAHLKDRSAPGAHLNPLRVAAGATLSASPSTTTDTSTPSPTSNAGARELPSTQDLDRLRLYLGEHHRAVDMMLESADHPPTWAAAIYGKYGPNGTLMGPIASIPDKDRPAVVATAMIEFATQPKRSKYSNPHFDGFIRKVVSSGQWKQPRADDGATGEAARGTKPDKYADVTEDGSSTAPEPPMRLRAR